MKYQAIFLTLLQARHALSKGRTASRPRLAAAAFSDCATWCHSEVECIAKHCHHEDADGPGIAANNGASDAADLKLEEGGRGDQTPAECAAGCRRLRFSPHRVQQCVDNCGVDEYDGPANARRSDPPSSESDAGGWNRNRSDAEAWDGSRNGGNGDRRRRSREERRRKRRSAQNNSSSPDRQPTEDRQAEGRADSPPGNDSACLRRCRNLRMSVRRQEVCIRECDAGEGTGEKSDSRLRRRSRGHHGRNHGSQEKFLNIAANDNPPGRDSACVALCKRRRFSPARQAMCIEECHQEETDDDDDYYDDDMSMSMSMSMSMDAADAGGHIGGNPARYDRDEDQTPARIY